MHYDPSAVLVHINHNKVAILAMCGLAMFFNYAWFISALRVGARDRVIAMPMFCSTFWFAHDTSFVARYDRWFHHYGSWYTELFWVALIATSLMEVAFLTQAVRYGRAEYLPSATQAQWTAAVVAATVAAVVVWSALKSVLNDDLYLASFGITVAAYPLCGIPVILRRRSLAHESRWMWGGYTGMAVCWFVASSLWFGNFGGALWTLLAITCAVSGFTVFVAVNRAHRAEGVHAGADPTTRAVRVTV